MKKKNQKRVCIFTSEEVSLLQYAVVHVDDFWVPDDKIPKAFKPKNKTVESILQKLQILQEVES